MKKLPLLMLCFLVAVLSLQAQDHKQDILNTIDEPDALSHFRFLAADELMGRDPIRPEMKVATRYIAEQFRKYGAKPINGEDEYLQRIPFRLSGPPVLGKANFGGRVLEQGVDLLVQDGADIKASYEMVVAGYGLADDLQGKDVKGKIIVARVGGPDRISPADLFALGREKVALAEKMGAVGVIEMYNVPTTPWGLVTNMLNRTRFALDAAGGGSSSMPYLWVRDLDASLIAAIDKGEIKQVDLEIKGKVNRPIQCANVIGVIEGTDPQLKNEYLLLSAHYDHVGVGRPDTSGDSIYNGARDNAVGTTAIINAAKYFAKHPPKRSIILAAWTAEEKGLLGSAFYADNPLIPHEQVIFNLNIDNGGYNDTSIITVIGLGRTTADPLIAEAVAAFGMEAIADPSPEQGLYDRSDNVNFARRGIPAPTFSLGFRAFDAEINKYYHQPGDQVDNFDLDYAMQYWRSYLLAARKIADWSEKPFWLPGDKYEEVGKQLYGRD